MEPDDPRERLAELRAQVARLEADQPRGGWWRSVVVVACLVLLALVAPAAVVATWAHDQVADTDRYVETMAPLADDPAVQRAVSARITRELVSRLDVRAVTGEAVDALADAGVPPRVAASLHALSTPLANGVESFVGEQVDRLVASDEFAAAWEQANREAHSQMVAVLTGETGQGVEVEGNAVRLNLAVLIDAVKARLVDAGFTLAGRLPTVTAQFTIFESADVERAQRGFRLLSAAARVLPVLAVVLLGVALLTARRKRRTLVAAALVVAGSMLALGLALNAFRVVYLDAVPTDRLPADAAGAIYDQLVSFIRLNLRAVLVLFLAVAAAAWVSGPGPAPVAVRRGTTRGLDVVRHGSDRAGLDTGPLGAFLGSYRTAIRGTVAGVVVLAYVMADHPTGAWTLTLLVAAAVVLLVTELLARDPIPPVPGEEAAPPLAGR